MRRCERREMKEFRHGYSESEGSMWILGVLSLPSRWMEHFRYRGCQRDLGMSAVEIVIDARWDYPKNESVRREKSAKGRMRGGERSVCEGWEEVPAVHPGKAPSAS